GSGIDQDADGGGLTGVRGDQGGGAAPFVLGVDRRAIGDQALECGGIALFGGAKKSLLHIGSLLRAGAPNQQCDEYNREEPKLSVQVGHGMSCGAKGSEQCGWYEVQMR